MDNIVTITEKALTHIREIVKNENIQHKLNAKVIVVLIILFFINPPINQL